MRYHAVIALLALMSTAVLADTRPAATPASRPAGRDEVRRKAEPLMTQALDFLKSAQTADGAWKGPVPGTDPAVTALVAKAFAQHPDYGPKHPIVRRAVQFVLKFQQPDGGIYSLETGFANYSTSAVLMALASMKGEGLEKEIAACQNYLKATQWTEGTRHSEQREIDTAHVWYGGAGYGEHKRPDLSNTQMMLEALHESGLPASDPAFQKALKFIARCQMHEGANDQPFARGVNDGGFIYSPANGGESKAGTDEVDGRKVLRSYGSMTYAGFKSMLYADLKRDDPRVQAAWDWIRRNYTLESNPNMPGAQSREGLFYFYHVFSRALLAWGEPLVVEPGGDAHDWRADLVAQLARLQNRDGSWVNEADRWQEGNPYLVTAYCVLALQSAVQ